MPIAINTSIDKMLSNENPYPDGQDVAPRVARVMALGITAATAAAVTRNVTVITNTTGGIILPLAQAGQTFFVYAPPSSSINVYAASGVLVGTLTGGGQEFLMLDNSGNYGMIGGVSGGSLARQPATNGNVFPFSNSDTANANYVRNFTSKKWVPVNGVKYSGVTLTFPWWVANPTNETATLPQVTLRASVVYNRVRYQLAFGGNQDILMTQGDTVVCDTIAGLVLDSAVAPYLRVNVRIVGPDTGSFLYPRSITHSEANNEGGLLNTNIAVDYTDATTVPIEAEATPIFTGAAITGATLTYAGANYTQTAEVYASDYDQYGHHFFKKVADATVAGGVVTGFTNWTGTPPTDTNCVPNVTLPAWTNPTLVISYGTANYNSVARGNVPGYTPCKVEGTPDRPCKSLAIWGNSLPRGNAQNAKPDKRGNFGAAEIAYANRGGTINYAIGSAQAQFFANMATNYPKLGAFIQSAAGFTTHGYIDSISNDIALAGQNFAQVSANLATMNTFFRAGGRLVTNATPSPRNTSSLTTDFINGVQTPFTGFGTGGVAQQMLALIAANTTIPSDFTIPRVDLVTANPAAPTEWRRDITCVTTDGTHEIGAGYGIFRTDPQFYNSLNPAAL